MRVLEISFPNFQSFTQDPLLDVLCYVLVVGWAMAVLFSCNASSGGMDIVAKIIHKYCRVELGRAVSISGIAVALISSLCSKNVDAKLVILSVVGTYFSGIMVDNFIFGMNIKRRICIISSKHDDVLSYIVKDLNSGASVYDVTGGRDMITRKEINVIVDKQEYRALMNYMKEIDPRAFITVYSVSEINYNPKK